jgi:hypothetical protein
MLSKLLKPNMATKGYGDVILLVVSSLWLFGGMAEMLYYSLNPPAYRYGGPGFIDSPDGWVMTTLSFAFDLLLIAVFAGSLCRVTYRVRHNHNK